MRALAATMTLALAACGSSSSTTPTDPADVIATWKGGTCAGPEGPSGPFSVSVCTGQPNETPAAIYQGDGGSGSVVCANPVADAGPNCTAAIVVPQTGQPVCYPLTPGASCTKGYTCMVLFGNVGVVGTCQ